MTQNITLDQILSGLEGLSKDELGQVRQKIDRLSTVSVEPQPQIKSEERTAPQVPVALEALSPLRRMEVEPPPAGPHPLVERWWTLVGTLNADQALQFTRMRETSDTLHMLCMVESDNVKRCNLNVVDKQRILDAQLGALLIAESLTPFRSAEDRPQGSSTAVKAEGRTP